jgi:hypothetical protein
MKKIITILLITISATALKAQNQTFAQMIDSIFQFVSKVDASTGILYNRVLPRSPEVVAQSFGGDSIAVGLSK